MINWIKWEDKGCAPHPDKKVTVQFRDGAIETNFARYFTWPWEDDNADIIAYYYTEEAV